MSTREGIRFSNLKHIGSCPARYKHHLSVPFEQTAPMRMGSIVDAILFSDNIVEYDGERRGNKWKEFAAEHDGELISSPKEMAQALAMAANVSRNELAMQALTGKHQVELFRDFAGHKLGGTLDVLGADFITDLKCTHDASPDRFPWQLRKMHYDAQLHWYGELARANGHTVDAYRIVAVEMKPPHPVTVFRILPRQLEAGAMKWRGWLETLLACQAADVWPEYSEAEVDVDVPDEDETMGLTGLEEDAA